MTSIILEGGNKVWRSELPGRMYCCFSSNKTEIRACHNKSSGVRFVKKNLHKGLTE